LFTTWNKPGLDRLPAGALNSLSKSVFVTFQRMETPMIYFYSEAERTVNVSVRFPQGPDHGRLGPARGGPRAGACCLDDRPQIVK